MVDVRAVRPLPPPPVRVRLQQPTGPELLAFSVHSSIPMPWTSWLSNDPSCATAPPSGGWLGNGDFDVDVGGGARAGSLPDASTAPPRPPLRFRLTPPPDRCIPHPAVQPEGLALGGGGWQPRLQLPSAPLPEPHPSAHPFIDEGRHMPHPSAGRPTASSQRGLPAPAAGFSTRPSHVDRGVGSGMGMGMGAPGAARAGGTGRYVPRRFDPEPNDGMEDGEGEGEEDLDERLGITALMKLVQSSEPAASAPRSSGLPPRRLSRYHTSSNPAPPAPRVSASAGAGGGGSGPVAAASAAAAAGAPARRRRGRPRIHRDSDTYGDDDDGDGEGAGEQLGEDAKRRRDAEEAAEEEEEREEHEERTRRKRRMKAMRGERSTKRERSILVGAVTLDGAVPGTGGASGGAGAGSAGGGSSGGAAAGGLGLGPRVPMPVVPPLPSPLPLPRVDNLCPDFDPAAALSFPAISILRALRERAAPVGNILNIQAPDAFLAFIYSMRTSHDRVNDHYGVCAMLERYGVHRRVLLRKLVIAIAAEWISLGKPTTKAKRRTRRRFFHVDLGLPHIPLSESNIGVTHALDVLARIVQRHPELAHIPADEHLVCAMVPRKRGEDGEPLLDRD